jgi:hypothetical protein
MDAKAATARLLALFPEHGPLLLAWFPENGPLLPRFEMGSAQHRLAAWGEFPFLEQSR